MGKKARPQRAHVCASIIMFLNDQLQFFHPMLESEFPSCLAENPLEVEGPDGLLGDTAFQLDKSILLHGVQRDRTL